MLFFLVFEFFGGACLLIGLAAMTESGGGFDGVGSGEADEFSFSGSGT